MAIPPKDPRHEYPGFEKYDPAKKSRDEREYWSAISTEGLSNFDWKKLIPYAIAVFAIFATLTGIMGAIDVMFGPPPSAEPGHVVGRYKQAQQQAQKMSDDMEKGSNLYGAIMRFKSDKGAFPNTLTDLIPRYVPDGFLHCASDPISDPSHITFIYVKPVADAPPTTPLFSFDSLMTSDPNNPKISIDMKTTYLINGDSNVGQTMQMPDKNGKPTSISFPTAH